MNSLVLAINCVVTALFIFMLAHCLDSPDDTAVRISRRPSGDIYYLNQSDPMSYMACNEDGNTTYLIADRCCISNQHLFNGKKYNYVKVVLKFLSPMHMHSSCCSC